KRDKAKGTDQLPGPWQLMVPIYQRPYVWQEEQIRQLCEDLCNACQDGREMYFIGGVLLVKDERKEAGAPVPYELVDGQQRMTTLWLIASVLAKQYTAMHPFLRIG